MEKALTFSLVLTSRLPLYYSWPIRMYRVYKAYKFNALAFLFGNNLCKLETTIETLLETYDQCDLRALSIIKICHENGDLGIKNALPAR